MQKFSLACLVAFYSFALSSGSARKFLLLAMAIFSVVSAAIFVKRKSGIFAILAASFAVSLSSGVEFAKCASGFGSILPAEKIVKISGCVASNPVKAKSGNYVAAFTPDRAFSRSEASSAAGRISVLFPSQIVEACYPDRLHSAAEKKNGGKSVPVVEEGLNAELCGRFIGDNFFKVETVKQASIGGKMWKNNFLRIRALARISLKKLLNSWGGAGGLLLALLSGSREYLEPRVADGFRSAGLSHVLALSGMHVSLFSALALKIGRKVKNRFAALMISMLAVCAFVFFAGLSPSLMRAFLSAAAAALFGLLSVKADAMSILAASFVAHILIAPHDAVQISFLLSYSAVFGIIAFQKTIFSILSRAMPPKIAAPFSASISAQAATFLFTLHFFSTVAPVGIVSSVFVSPLVSVFLIFGFFAVIACAVFPPLIFPAGFAVNALYFAIAKIVCFFAKFSLQ